MQIAKDAVLRGVRQRWLAICGVAVLAVLGVVLIGRTNHSAAARKGPAPIPVTAVKVVRQDVPIYLQGLGTVQAFNSVNLKVRVDGTLDAVLFKEGQAVKSGELLVRIDPRPYQAAFDLAAAIKAKDASQLANAKRDLDRYIILEPEAFTSKQTVDSQRALVTQLEAQVKGDQATVERAQIDLDFTSIRSPIDGRIGLRQVDVGNVVHAVDQGALAVVSQIRPIAVVFTLPADDLPDITKAMHAGHPPVKIYRYDDTEKLADGELLAIESVIDQTTGTIRLKATVANLDDSLWPGEAIRAHMLVRTEQQALTIPEPAVQRGPNGFFTYVVKPDSTVAIQPIEVVDGDAGRVVVKRGLNDGDLVVTVGQSRLQPGATVKVARDEPPPANTSAPKS